MSDKQKRKSKQKNRPHENPVYWALFMLIAVLLIGWGIGAYSNYETERTYRLTATQINSENLTRQVQIEASTTAQSINQTATAEANVTQSP